MNKIPKVVRLHKTTQNFGTFTLESFPSDENPWNTWFRVGDLSVSLGYSSRRGLQRLIERRPGHFPARMIKTVFDPFTNREEMMISLRGIMEIPSASKVKGTGQLAVWFTDLLMGVPGIETAVKNFFGLKEVSITEEHESGNPFLR
jgi:hypothetical protein